MPSIDFDAVRRMIDLRTACELFQYRTAWANGVRSRGPCPCRCCPDARCCSLDFNQSLWHCHKCKAGGSVVLFAAAVLDQPLYDAVERLCHLAGKPVPYLPRSKNRRPRAPRTRKKDLEEEGCRGVE